MLRHGVLALSPLGCVGGLAILFTCLSTSSFLLCFGFAQFSCSEKMPLAQFLSIADYVLMLYLKVNSFVSLRSDDISKRLRTQRTNRRQCQVHCINFAYENTFRRVTFVLVLHSYMMLPVTLLAKICLLLATLLNHLLQKRRLDSYLPLCTSSIGTAIVT